MLIAYGIHRGGGPGSCDVHTKTSIVNGLTGNFTNLNMSECPSSNFDLHFKISIYDVIVSFFIYLCIQFCHPSRSIYCILLIVI